MAQSHLIAPWQCRAVLLQQAHFGGEFDLFLFRESVPPCLECFGVRYLPSHVIEYNLHGICRQWNISNCVAHKSRCERPLRMNKKSPPGLRNMLAEALDSSPRQTLC